jgi:hypothetical protein
MLVMHEPMKTSSTFSPVTSRERASSGSLGQQRIGLGELVHVDLDRLDVLGARVGLHERRLREPVLHVGDAPLERARVAVALGDHPLEHRDVRREVLGDGRLVELDRAAGGRALGRGVGELEGLLALEVAEALDLEDAPEKTLILPCFSTVSRPRCLRCVRDGVHEVAQRDARLHRRR